MSLCLSLYLTLLGPKYFGSVVPAFKGVWNSKTWPLNSSTQLFSNYVWAVAVQHGFKVPGTNQAIYSESESHLRGNRILDDFISHMSRHLDASTHLQARELPDRCVTQIFGAELWLQSTPSRKCNPYSQRWLFLETKYHDLVFVYKLGPLQCTR